MSESAVIESRTIDGRVFIAAQDFATALRQRADDHEFGVDGLDPEHAVAYQAVARELRARADALDCAVIEHVSE